MQIISITSALEIAKLPVLPLSGSLMPAGFPSPAADYIDSKIDMNEWLIKNPSSSFLFRVQGDSMENMIFDKSYLIVDRSLTAKNNNIIVASIDGELTVKRLIINKKGNYLKPENSKYPNLPITETTDFTVWGVVTSIITDPRII